MDQTDSKFCTYPGYFLTLSKDMEEEKLCVAVKRLCFEMQGNKRFDAFHDIIYILEQCDINEGFIKEICDALTMVLLRKDDNLSRLLIQELLTVLFDKHQSIALKYIMSDLIEISNKFKNMNMTSNTANKALHILKITCFVYLKIWQHNGDVPAIRTKLVDVQSTLLCSVISVGLRRKTLKVYKMLHLFWSTIPGSAKLYLETLSGLEQTQQVLILASAVVQHLSDTKKAEEVDEHKAKLLDTLIKTFITAKRKPSKTLVEGTYPFLAVLTVDDFKATLLPAMQKAILRNPEVINECVGLVFGGLDFDISDLCHDIGRGLFANLCAKDDSTRTDTISACRMLSPRINSCNTLQSLVMHLFDILNGSNGKLTVIMHKIGILETIGNFSLCPVNDDDLTSSVVRQLLNVLNTEVNEKALCFTLHIVSLWGSKYSKDMPKEQFDLLKKGIDLKTSTQLVRISYIRTMLVLFQGNKLSEATTLVPMLLKIVERSTAQSAQYQVITEGLLASCLLLELTKAGGLKDNLHGLWNAILDVDKQVFISEKHLMNAAEDSLEYVVDLCGKLLSDYSSKLKGDLGQLYRATLFSLTSGSFETRKKCMDKLTRYTNDLKGVHITRQLLKCFVHFLDTTKSVPNDRENELGKSIASNIVSGCIENICSSIPSSFQEEAELVALDALVCCHHPSVYQTNKNLWVKITRSLNFDPKTLTIKHFVQLKKTFIDEYKNLKVNENVLRTIVRLNPHLVLPDVVKHIINNLNDKRIIEITEDDYFIFLTPEGELYDKSVVPGNDFDNAMNMKRESKAYSYREQLEEMQLRRELEEKKRKEGKIKAPQYTPKQLEAMKNQRSKEQVIRNRLKEINCMILNTVSMFEAALRGSQTIFLNYFKDILPLILHNLQSPLSAPPLMNLFMDLRKVIFKANFQYLATLIAHITLRLEKPKCDLDTDWEQEDINKATVRVVRMMYKSSVECTVIKRYFTTAAFCYSFPMLRTILLSLCNKNETVMYNGMQFISEHVKLNMDGDLYNIVHLPRKQILDTLIILIGKTSGRVQSQAMVTLLDVTSSCAENATFEEISVLLEALRSSSSMVRDASLRGLQSMKNLLPQFIDDVQIASVIKKQIWISKFDVNEENRALAEKLWNDIELNSNFPAIHSSELIKDIEYSVDCIQQAASSAISTILENDKEQIKPMLKKFISLYKERLNLIPPKLDEFGREIEKPVDVWEPRRGVALTLTKLAPSFDSDDIGHLVEFFVSTALADRKEDVRQEMLTAALKIVDLHGKDTVSTLLPVFENFMDKSSKSAHFDAVKQAVVVLMGSLARHLEKDDPRIKPIVLRLISALSTPSQQVQESVSNCLPFLVPSIKDDAPGLVNKLLHQLLKSDKYGERKGAAYGLAGLVKGMGILALKQLDIMTKLTDAIQDKKNYKHREGALFAFEMLFQMLGKLFEPYIVHVLPHLLQCFGDTSQYVRTATDDMSKVVMSKLSGHGVKLVLPSLLAALEEDSWRTKTGSIELLGAMAYCAPKQLSSCLPSIVPKLIEVLSDSHTKVQQAGTEALGVIGSVIRNPEIQAIVPVLLQALQDPANKTSACLQTLLDTKFVHFIDAPSLALIMPVVQRAFMDRSTETRKMAAQIIGNMYSLTDQKDLTPYLPTIIPGLKSSLLDPVPEVRSVSARALGAMVRGMGESSFEDLLPWLMQTLTSESSSVDRSGAAQGLSEVVGGLGVEKLNKLMPEIIATAERADIAPHVKDGYIMMFIYMPVVFTNEFTPYIGQIINPILKALADENEYVRDTALKAGQRIVTLYADSAILLLLPELEKGLFDENWRIRYSSVQLLGDLLYRISGVTGKMSTETASEDDNFGTEQSHMAIISALGAERRNRVLAGLYMGRSDVALMVRQAALHVWKVVVTNTPRTLREILPTLFGLLLGCLASDSYDKRQVAARTLGDLVRKLGERVLPEIIPILEKGLQSNQSDQRQGVCIGLSEIMTSTSREMVLTFVNSLVPTVRKALCDPLPEVREAAAKTFDSLHSTVGPKALDDILPPMLNQLNSEDPKVVEWTLDGLRQVMAIKSRVVLPYLVPQLTAQPPNTKALSILSSVAGEALNKYLPRIFPALFSALADAINTPEEPQQLEYCQTVVLSVVDEVGVRTVVDTLLDNTRTENLNQRKATVILLCAFCANSKAQYTNHVPQLLRGLIHLCTDSDKDVLRTAWEALNAVTKSLEPKQLATYVSDVRQAVRYAISDMKNSPDLLPGFCLPKGIFPILPIFREAILNGDGDEKEAAAQGLGEVIKLTNAQALQPSVITITGPLIRILGDRFNASVKIAVLETLAILLAKVGVMLKQFLPQLQTTFLKALNDPNRNVRLKSSTALSYLILIHQKADTLFTDLHNTLKSTEDSSIRETTLHALRGIIGPAGDKVSPLLKKQIHHTLIGLLSNSDDVTRTVAAGCLGSLCKWLPSDILDVTIVDHILSDDSTADVTLRCGRSASLSVTLKESPEILWTDQYQKRLEKTLTNQLTSNNTSITSTAVRSTGYLLRYILINNLDLPALFVPFVKSMNNNSNDVKQLLARVCIHLAKTVPSAKMSPEFLKLLLPMLVNGTKEKNGYVKANSEIALIAVLKLKEGDEMYQKCLNVLDIGARESLSDVVSKVLKKVMLQPEGKEEELDETLLT